MQAEFAALQAQVATLNGSLADMISTQKSVDPSGFRRLAKAAEVNSRVFRDAAASTGLFETQQVRVNSATDEYVKKLNSQKLAFRDMMKQRKVATAAYREQLAMEQMIVRQNPAGSLHGKQTFDVIWPKEYEKSLDSAGRRLEWFNAQLKSGATQMVNWGKNTQWAGRQLMVGFTMPIMAFGAAAGVAAYQVDQQFTRIAKVYDTQADKLTDLAGWEREVEQLRADGYQTARVAARDYQSAINDTLGVQAELAATGKTGMELQQATNEVMRISTLGELDRAEATEATIALQSIWRMNTTELADAFNYLNATENATSLSTQDFVTAIPIAASTVKAFGGDIKELGILMTAMKERGIDAGEGANAIKATMQRLGRPSKQVQEEFSKLTGESIVDLVDGSNGLIEVFTNLNRVTSDLSQNDQRKVFAGLFGSYQVSRMMALTKGMGELEQGIGQVSEAARVAGMSTEDMADIAQSELEALQKSVSGRFKAAWEELKIIMGEVGMPFLEAGTVILETFTKIMGAINGLPDVAKLLLGWSVAIAAVAGPMVMLTGLFANLFGNGIKTIAGLITGFGKLTGGMTIADRQSRIYSAAAKMAETQHLQNTRAVNSLNSTMSKLVAAQQAATTASQKEAAAMGVTVKLSAARKKVEDERIRQMQIQNRLMQEHAMIAKDGSTVYHNRDLQTGKYKVVNEEQARAAATQYIDDREAAYAYNAQQSAARASAASAQAAKEEADARMRTRVAAAGAAVETSAMAASMLLMTTTSNETANNIGKWLMIGSIAVPAAVALGKALSVAATAAGALATRLMAANAASIFSRGAWSGGLTALTSMVGKTGLLGIGLGIVGGAAYFVWKHFNDIKKEQQRIDAANGRLIGQTERWAAATGRAVDNYKKLRIAQQAGASSEDMMSRVEYYKSDDEKEETESFNDMDGIAQSTTLMGKYIDMVEGAGMSTKEATKEVQAFLVATGMTFIEAQQKAEELTNSIGRIGDNASEWTNKFAYALGDIVRQGYEGNEETAKAAGQQAGSYYAQAFINGNKTQKETVENQLRRQVLDPWESIISDMDEMNSSMDPLMLDENIATITGSLGITREDWEEATSSGERFRSFYMSLDKDMRSNLRGIIPFGDQIQEAEGLERVIVGGISEALGTASQGVDTLGELFNDAAYKAEAMWSRFGGNSKQTLAAAQKDVNALYKQLTGADYQRHHQGDFNALVDRITNTTDEDVENMSDSAKKKFEEQKEALNQLLPALAAYNQMLGIDPASTSFGGIINLMGGFQMETEESTDKVQKLDSELKNLDDVDLSIDVMVNMMQDIRGGIQEDMADLMTEDFDNRMQADIDRTQNYWDNRQAGLDAEMDRRSNALDAKWEQRKDGAEKYWENRVKMVEKAIEAEEKAEEKRQKMFDAEIDRMEKWADAQNQNIDFNIALNEGRLDEAAQIANNIQAGESTGVFERAAEASQNKSDRRTEGLEDRKEDIEAQKDAAMKAMDAREKAEKAHLDKVSDMRKKALQADADAAMEAKQQEWDTRKAAFEEQMQLFLAFTARNDKELKAHMEAVGISYDKFGGILKAKGTDWSTYMGREMKERVRLAALELRNDAAWSSLGEGAVNAMITAMGFKSKAQFQHFIKTGEMKDLQDPGPAGASSAQGKNNEGRKGKQEEVGTGAHQGGWAGKTGNDRTGVARTQRGLHPNEIMIRAQKGEFIVNRKQAKQHGDLLGAINDGTLTGGDDPNMIGVGGNQPMAGMVAGGIMRSMMFGIMKNVKSKVDAAKAYAAAANAGAGPGSPGMDYSAGPGGWHIPAARGYGWSNSHDYSAPGGTPLYAVGDGVITESRAVRSGGSSTYPGYPAGYTSYGETVAMRLNNGETFRWAHLTPGTRIGTGPVKGGTMIGRSGMTGNASGYHVHMEGNGSYDASGWLARHGIALKEGAANINFDNTPAILHKNEAVLTEGLNRKFHEGVNRFANGASVVYDIDINGEGLDTKEIVREVITEINKKEKVLPQSRTIGNRRPR